MANEAIGMIDCAHCGTRGEARRNKKGKLYYFCPSCGLTQPALPGFQQWMREHMTVTVEREETEGEPAVPTTKEPATPRRGMFAGIEL